MRNSATGLLRYIRAATGALLIVALAGCATPYFAKQMHSGRAVFDDKRSVAVVVVVPAKAELRSDDVFRGGAPGQGLIQMAIIAANTRKLDAHAQKLPLDAFAGLQRDLVAALTKRGIEAKVIDAAQYTAFRADKFDFKDGSTYNLDLRPLRERWGVERLLVVTVSHVGFNHPYGGFIPVATGDPMAYVEAEAFLLDLQNNAYQWLKRVRTLRGVGKDWEHPPEYAQLTTKYFEALEVARDEIVDDLTK